MNGKMIVGIGLIVGIVAIALLAAPIRAYVNGAGNGDVLEIKERDRLRTQNRDYHGDCTRTQHRYRQRVNESATNNIRNCTMNMEQCRHQNRESTGKP